MSLDVLWTIPVAGERHRSGTEYFAHIARAAEAAGLGGLLVPLDAEGDDAWVIATALARVAPRLRIVPEFTPAFASAVYTAKLSLSFQRFFADRLGWKLRIDDGAALGGGLDDAVRGEYAYLRAQEYLETAAGVWGDEPFTYRGRFVEVVASGFFQPAARHNQRGHRLERRALPPVYLDGTSDAALRFSARFADVHIFDALPPAALRGWIERHRVLAAEHGRRPRYGIRLRVVAREFEHEALRAARRAFGDAIPDDAVVGSHAGVASRLRDYAAAGISTFAIAATPALEEAYEFGHYVLPSVAAGDAAAALGRG